MLALAAGHGVAAAADAVVRRAAGVMWSSVGGRRSLCALALVSVLLHVPSVYLRQDRWAGSRRVDEHAEKQPMVGFF